MSINAQELRWIALVAAFLAPLVVLETTLWHYRSGFALKAQYVPIIVGALLTLACALAAALPNALSARLAVAAGWLAIVAGFIGVAYHHWYGIVKKAGGYRWLLHWLMHAAPQLAPFALATAGAAAVVAGVGLEGRPTLFSLSLARVVLGIVAVALGGAMIQTAVLHYRGAFNTRFMYAPFVAPPVAAVLAAAIAFDVTRVAIRPAAEMALWLSVLTGIAGLGLHLRGLDRRMGGLYVGLSNVLEGPPPLAPAFYTAVAALGLIALRMR